MTIISSPLLYFWNLLGHHKVSFVFMILTSICKGLLRLMNVTYSMIVIGLIYHYRMRLTTIFWFILIVQTLLALMQAYLYTGELWILRQELMYYRYLSRKHWNTILHRIFNNASYEWIMQNTNETELVQQMSSLHSGLNRLLQELPRCIIQIIFSSIIMLITIKVSLALAFIYFIMQVAIVIFIINSSNKDASKRIDNKITANFFKSARNIFGTMFDAVLNNKNSEHTLTTYFDDNCRKLNQEFSRKQYSDRRSGLDIISIFYILHCVIIVFFLFISLDNIEQFITIYLWIRTIFIGLQYLLIEISLSTVDLRLFETDFLNLQKFYQATAHRRKQYRQIKLHKNYELEMDKFTYTYESSGKFQLNSEQRISFNSGDVILIDGETGSGKSTLLKIIRSIYTIPSMRLRYKNMDPDYGGEWIHLENGWNNLISSICFCQQSMTAFVDNRMYHIVSSTFPGEIYDKDLAETAMKIADIPERLWNRETITDTEVSGGERQRISIARIIYHILQEENRNIIILDEIDSNLDFSTSQRIFEKILKICQDKIVLIVAHSPSIKQLRQITKVINIKNGNITI